MVKIPTTERKYYNTTPKVNTLATFTQALIPVAKQYAETELMQEKVKIDTNETKARIELDNFQKQWQLANQANPDNAQAKADFQTGMQSILDKYGQQINPVARMDWNVTANKLKTSFDVANNDWAFKQKGENAKANVAENINLNLDLAYRHGLEGNIEGGWADLDSSYRQLYSYAMPALGEMGAKDLLSEYKGNFTKSFLSGLIERDPQEALNFLNEEGNQKAIGSERKVGALRAIAEKKVKEYATLKKQNFNLNKSLAYIDFLENPSFDNLDYYVTNYEPEMSETKYKRLIEHVETVNPNAETVNEEEYLAGLRDLAQMSEGTYENDEKFTKGVSDYIYNLHTKNHEGKLRAADLETLKKISNQIMKDPAAKEAVKNMPVGEEFNKIEANVQQPMPEIPQINDMVTVENNRFVVKPKEERITSRAGLTRQPKNEEEESIEPITYTTKGEAEAAMDELKDMPVETEEQKMEFLAKAQEIYTGIYLGSSNPDFEDTEDLFNDLSEITAEKFMTNLDNMPQTGFIATAKESWNELSDTDNLGAVDLNEDRTTLWAQFKDAISPMTEQFGNIKRSIGVWTQAWKKSQMIKQIKKETMHKVLGHIINKDYDAAKSEYENGIKRAIRTQYLEVPDLQRDDLEPGKSLVTINGIPYKFMGYTADNILVEVQ